MRSLEECKAEVFRRSEKIIKQRKVARRCIIAACVPLVLVLSVCLAMVVPAMMPASADNAEAEAPILEDTEKYIEASINNSPTAESVTVVVEGAEYSVFGEDALAATQFLQELEYNPAKVCKCLPQFQIVTVNGSYGIHLGESYARCEAGQAALTIEQESILLRLLHTAVPDWTPSQKVSE